jgi:hypothetical protein
MAFTLKQGDLRPQFVVVLKDNIGEETEDVVDLTTATSAVFNMVPEGGGAVKINRGSATIDSPPTNGQVTYAWGTADTNTVGTFNAEIEVLWADGKPETFPNDSYWTVEIVDDLA